MNPLLSASATALARAVRTGAATSRELVELHIGYIRAVNPALNALVADRFAEALAEAERADAELAQGGADSLGPLHGVPCTIKECFAVTGMPQSSGLVARRDYRADRDATAVARLRAAGAIALGVTNTSELCMWMESSNRLYGRTNNPYDPSRIVGGSSGGEGAIVGSGASPFGLAADVGGSIRMPAFFNGVFGHKPTGTMVPATGQFPSTHGRGLRYLSTGPLCRRAEDLFPLLKILAGPDGLDSECREWPLRDPTDVRIERVRVLSVPDNGRNPVDSELAGRQVQALHHLVDAGARRESIALPALKHSFDIWSAMLAEASGSDAFKNMMRRSTGGLWAQLGLWCMGRSPHTFPAIALGLLENMNEWLPRRTERILTMGRELRQTLRSTLRDDAVLLFPSYSRPAPRHYQPLMIRFEWAYTAIMNVMELPVTQVPLGLSRDGLPLGVQIVGGPGQDHLTIAVAMELERAFGGWVPPWQASDRAVTAGRAHLGREAT